MIKQILYFLITVSILYSLLVTLYLVVNKQFSHDYQWCLINAVITACVSSLFIYLYNRKKQKVK